MAYETIVLTDGMEVLFAIPDEPQETGSSEAETPQRDPKFLVAAITAESRVDRLRKGAETAQGRVTASGKAGPRAPRCSVVMPACAAHSALRADSSTFTPCSGAGPLRA